VSAVVVTAPSRPTMSATSTSTVLNPDFERGMAGNILPRE